MKSKLLTISAIFMAMAFTAPAFAQEPLPNALGGAGAFHDFLGNHPQIRHDLEKNPNLINDPEYVEHHPAFNEFYSKHPEVRGEMKENAPEFMRREEWAFKHPEKYQGEQARWRNGVREEREERNTDKFMDTHPNVERKLEEHPGRANNPEFLKTHPGFAHFEETHPGVQQQMQNHPRKFMNREQNYDRSH
jgi:hypothetical protein